MCVYRFVALADTVAARFLFALNLAAYIAGQETYKAPCTGGGSANLSGDFRLADKVKAILKTL
jgi:hypothetical protein